MKIYTLVSPYERLVKLKIAEVLKTCHLGSEGVTSYDMTETTIQEAIFDVSSGAFLTGKKAVLIKNPYFLTASTQKGPDHNMETLSSYLDNPSHENVLIIHAPYEKLDERKKVVKTLKKKSDVIKIDVPNSVNLLDYVRRELTSYNLTFDERVVQELVKLTKENFDRLHKELIKIRDYFGNAEMRECTVELIRQLVPQTLEDNVFLLTEALANKNVKMAHAVFSDLMVQKEEPIKLVVMIANQFRLFKQVQLLQISGMYEKEIASTLGVHPYRVKIAMGQSRIFRPEELDLIIGQLAEIDLQIKTGQTCGEMALEVFIMGI